MYLVKAVFLLTQQVLQVIILHPFSPGEQVTDHTKSPENLATRSAEQFSVLQMLLKVELNEQIATT